MKRSSKDFFEALSQYCYVSKTPLLFQKSAIDSPRDKGVLKAFEWVDALCFYYLQKEKRLQKEFMTLIEKHQQEIEALPHSAYRSGLLEALVRIREKIVEIERVL